MSPDFINLLIGLGAGSVIVAVINGFFNRGGNKATAAKLVADTTKVAHDMVMEIADDLREDNAHLRNALADMNAKFEGHERRLELALSRLDRTVGELQSVIPLIEQAGHLSRADHLRRVVADATAET
ncbi:hypothetical protein HOT75_gp034 [Gordonia phage Daredevil]|uniref:Uncharacterized protein n=1 Tax=Gordonia phage Daredevil TaxID=2283286 RepID=A0A345MIP1_9CAUD|nr:hypothetical protein HOT75_gp034 [Gordonia phage Daredevil]AXH70422.1 hypothetical protein SEA_DAREDEVIL_34 [Gordonia phage Daredevil]